MIDLKFLRENPEVVKQNIRNKFQDSKLPLVDEVIALDTQYRAYKQEADNLRGGRNKLSKQIGMLMAQGKREEAEAVKKQVTDNANRLAELEMLEAEYSEKIKNEAEAIISTIEKTLKNKIIFEENSLESFDQRLGAVLPSRDQVLTTPEILALICEELMI